MAGVFAGQDRCWGCGVQIAARSYRGGCQRKWCSRACECRAKRHGTGVIPTKLCVVCGYSFKSKRSDVSRCDSQACIQEMRNRARRKRMPPVVCTPRECAAHGCDIVFTPSPSNNEKARFCCYNCFMRANAAKYRHRRESAEKAAFVEDVDPGYIFRRDNWRCHLCKKKVHKSKRAPDRMSPSLDHIVPLTKGGKHEKSNVATAHFGCNARKNNRGFGDQLALLG